MKHPIMTSRVLGATDEILSLKKEWTPERISAEYTDARLIKIHKTHKKLCAMPRTDFSDAQLKAVVDILLRFSVLPGTSTLLVGDHGRDKAHYESKQDPATWAEQLRFHQRILSIAGTLPFSKTFAYAMDVEAPGNIDSTLKFNMQSYLIGELRKTYPTLMFVCSTKNWSNPSDLVGYKLPATNTVARVGFYEPFVVTHWWTSELGLDAPIPYPLTQEVADRIVKDSPRITERGKQELQKAVGFNKLSMETILRDCIATGTEFLITEAGIFKQFGFDDGSAARWFADLKSVCYKLGIPFLVFSTGSTQGTRGYAYGLGLGL